MQTRSSPSIVTLHSLAKQASIQNYEKLPKSVLYKKLQESFNMERLQRVEARRKKLNEILSKKRSVDYDINKIHRKLKKQENNKLDPIMMNSIDKKMIWKFLRSNGKIICFNIESLIDYMMATGDFTDPETRIPFSDENLKEIDNLAIKYGLKKPSLYAAKINPNTFSDFIFRRDALQGLERCAGEVVTEILNIIETSDPDEAEMRLVMRELPLFSDYYRQLCEADLPFSQQCMKHWRLFLQGPPNRPNHDNYGLIAIVLQFFSMCRPTPAPRPSPL